MKSDSCVKCGKCTKNCEFLKKYDINLNDLENKKNDCINECFLCGKCKSVCPVDIDGREIVLELRKNQVQSDNLNKKPYKSVILEKKKYIFKNYKAGNKPIVLFPGCNYPSFFPRTTEKIIKILSEELDAGVVFDCCGKPIAELGMEEDSNRIIQEINSRMKKNGVEEIVTLCPNCYHFLKDKLDAKVVDIYDKLRKIRYNIELPKRDYNMFLPCPDRENEEMLKSIIKLLHNESSIKIVEDVQCCGLGGLAGCVDKETPKLLINKLKNKKLDNLYTYCATCYGNFRRNGIDNAKHILSDIVGIEESFPKGAISVLNRASFKFK